MANQVLRFGVTDGKDKRAATWNLTARKGVNGPEIYLSCRELGGTMHTSFHGSGSWHSAYTREAFEKHIKEVAPEGTDRFIEKWPRPTEIKPGVTVAYKILTPWTTVTTPRQEGERAFVEIPAAAEGNVIETTILLIDPKVQVDTTGVYVAGALPLSNSDTAMVISAEGPMPKIKTPGKVTGRLAKGVTKEDLKSENIRALVFSDDDKGNRLIVEYVAKSEE
ncbi:MAG: hypothetical protein WDZ84_01495 [Rhodovibrionaceae bacterium]